MSPWVCSLPGHPEPDDRLDEFTKWLRERRRPHLLDRLMPDGELDPARARLWKRSLLSWRREVGLENPLR